MRILTSFADPSKRVGYVMEILAGRRNGAPAPLFRVITEDEPPVGHASALRLSSCCTDLEPSAQVYYIFLILWSSQMRPSFVILAVLVRGCLYVCSGTARPLVLVRPCIYEKLPDTMKVGDKPRSPLVTQSRPLTDLSANSLARLMSLAVPLEGRKKVEVRLCT